MSILFGSDVDIQLANTSFNCNTTSSMSVALFTATDKGTYHFTGTLTATTQNSSFGFGFLINGTYKDLRTTDYATGPLDVNLDFTADVGDIITLSASGIGTGSNLAVTEDVKKPREIYVGEGKQVYDYSAMRGPCPEGFHVPTKDEWVALCGILTSTFGMASNATTMGTYLKMPTAGLRNRSSAGVAGLGSNGYYWSSTAYSSGRTYYLYITSSSLNPQEGGYRATGFSVRCFKDAPVTPDSNWTTLYQGTGSAGVFRNSSLGLISVSGDGTTWYTIQDKNLGATTVYNQGDTANDANCGYFYQWGNNYGFPHSGTITSSTTQVDASNYGPGNYYSSSTFIKVSSSPYDWSSVPNDNLRGGETGVQQKHIGNVKEVYVGTTKVRPSGWTYSYTFKGKTAAEIGNEWTVLNGSIVTNSDGFTGSNNNDARIAKNIPNLANAKKIIISGTVVGQNLSTTAALIGVGKGTGWGTGEVSYQVFGSSYNGIKVNLNYNNTDTNGNSVGNATAQTYKPTLTVDLVNKTIVGSMSGFSNSTLSLTDAQVADIRTYEYIVCYVSFGRSTISDVSIKIEPSSGQQQQSGGSGQGENNGGNR